MVVKSATGFSGDGDGGKQRVPGHQNVIVSPQERAIRAAFASSIVVGGDVG